MHKRIVCLVLAGLAVGLIACSSDDTPPAGGAGSAGAGGSAGGAGGAGGAAGSQGACEASKLVGVWGGASYSMEIVGDGTYRASGTPNMASIDVNGTVQIDGCNIKLTDTTGKYACPSTQIGEYTFTVSDTTLAFTLVSDPCDGRKTPLTAGPLTKK
jgi:hypothetical protein